MPPSGLAWTWKPDCGNRATNTPSLRGRAGCARPDAGGGKARRSWPDRRSCRTCGADYLALLAVLENGCAAAPLLGQRRRPRHQHDRVTKRRMRARRAQRLARNSQVPSRPTQVRGRRVAPMRPWSPWRWARQQPAGAREPGPTAAHVGQQCSPGHLHRTIFALAASPAPRPACGRRRAPSRSRCAQTRAPVRRAAPGPHRRAWQLPSSSRN